MNKLLRMALILTSFQNPDALNLHHSGYVRSLSGTVAASSVKLDSTLRTEAEAQIAISPFRAISIPEVIV